MVERLYVNTPLQPSDAIVVLQAKYIVMQLNQARTLHQEHDNIDNVDDAVGKSSQSSQLTRLEAKYTPLPNSRIARILDNRFGETEGQYNNEMESTPLPESSEDISLDQNIGDVDDVISFDGNFQNTYIAAIL